MNKLANRIIYLTDLFKVIEVISFPREATMINLTDSKYDEFQVMEFLGNDESDALKVGDLIPLEFNRCRFLKQIGPYPISSRNRFNFQEAQNYNQVMFDTFISNFDPDLIRRVRENLKGLSSDNEVAYRCFYNSFKMYRLKDYVIEMAEILLSVAKQSEVKHTTVQDLVEDFKMHRFDDVLERCLIDIVGTDFSMGRNTPEAWYEDSQKLFSSYFLFMKATDYLITFCETLIDKTNIIQNPERRILDWNEAGAMTVWSGVSFLRTASNESINEKLKKLKV